MTANELNLKNAQSKANGQATTASTSFHNPANARVNAPIASATILPPTTNPEPTFHERELARMASDPENGHYQAAVILGKQRANAFLAAATTLSHPKHEAAFASFRDDFSLDSALLENSCIAQAAKELGAAPFEKQDPNYVRNLKAKYKPTMKSPVMEQMYNLFCEAVDAKHAKVGYRGDKAFVAMASAKYKLAPNEHLLEHKQFEPKD
jgi:hypothetical protein